MLPLSYYYLWIFYPILDIFSYFGKYLTAISAEAAGAATKVKVVLDIV
jgi:hypothetical protein